MKTKKIKMNEEGPVGYGKNYHTANPEPVSWESMSELQHFLTELPDGRILAGLSLPGTEEATPTYTFNSEEEAMHWIRNASQKYTVEKFNQEF